MARRGDSWLVVSRPAMLLLALPVVGDVKRLSGLLHSIMAAELLLFDVVVAPMALGAQLLLPGDHDVISPWYWYPGNLWPGKTAVGVTGVVGGCSLMLLLLPKQGNIWALYMSIDCCCWCCCCKGSQYMFDPYPARWWAEGFHWWWNPK